MQSMKDNEVWDLVDLPPNGKTVGSKWLFKKKTDMDGAVHTYKARLVAKGYTQTPGIDYEETFSPVADIRAIRILIAITTFYDYEIWQMDVKTVCINAYLSEEVLHGASERCFAMKDLGEAAYILRIKIYRDRSRWLIGTSTPAELKRMQNVPYALAVGSIMYVVRCTRPDVAFAQNITSRFQQNPGDLHWNTVKNILKYLRNTKDMFLVYGAVWVRKFISGLGIVPTIKELISMYCDNTGAITIANESGFTKGARHFRAKVHYLREVIEFGDIKLEKVHTDDNLADHFTKALAFPKHSEHTRNIGMLSASSLM
ncbi:retrotransposon protein, putative, ty1-copia subclass [Tanacetum coccineum]